MERLGGREGGTNDDHVFVGWVGRGWGIDCSSLGTRSWLAAGCLRESCHYFGWLEIEGRRKGEREVGPLSGSS